MARLPQNQRGLCETVVSQLLGKSNIGDFVSYSPIITFDGKNHIGCRSNNFRAKNESLITLELLSNLCTAFRCVSALPKLISIPPLARSANITRRTSSNAPGISYIIRERIISIFSIKRIGTNQSRSRKTPALCFISSLFILLA